VVTRSGDQVLQTFAVRLQGLVRPTDAVARLGGAEFAVALTGIRKLEDAALVADEIVDMAQQPMWSGSPVLIIGAVLVLPSMRTGVAAGVIS
jgi:diguanylate cyclase (GGDEF)-like protein